MGTPRDGEVAAGLAILAGAWNVERIAAWEVRGQEVVPLCVRHLWRGDLELAARMWRERSGELRAGRKVHLGNAEFHPLRDGRQALIGFVQVAYPARDATPRMDAVANQVLVELSAAIASEDSVVTQHAPARRRHTWPWKRAELVLALDHHEWNFTRLAAARGVTRQTVGNWVRRFGLQRPPWARRGKRPSD